MHYSSWPRSRTHPSPYEARLWLCRMARTTGIFPGWTGFFPREKSGEFEGKIRLAHAARHRAVWGMRVEKPSSMAFVFQAFRQYKEKRRPGTFAILAPGLYNRYNHAHVPGPHMWQSPGPGPCSKYSKTVEVGCSYSVLKPCQREIATDKIQKNQKYRVSSEALQ